MGVRFDVLVLEVQKEFPKFKIVYKSESWFSKLLNVLLLIITFGQQKEFMTRYTTVIGTTMYVPSSWDDRSEESKIITLRHERIHFRQAKKYTRFFFSILYLFVFFPAVFAYFRKKFEQEAYKEGMIARMEYYGPDSIKTEKYKEYMISQFTSAKYFWSWPFRKSISRWFDKTLEEVLSNSDL